MELKKTKERPANGQFIAVWEHNGKPWCETQMVEDCCLYGYDSKTGDWFNHLDRSLDGLDVSYFVPIKREKFEVYDVNGKYYRSTDRKEEAVFAAKAINGTIRRFIEDGNVNF